MATLVEEARYIFADIQHNNNKFWHASLFDDGTVEATWGRVGEAGTKGTWNKGRSYFDAKCREKEGKGYKRQQVLTNAPAGSPNAPRITTGKDELAAVAVAQVDTNSDLVKMLLKRLAAINVHSILAQTTLKYDESKGTFSTPLGIVTAAAIAQARDELSVIAKYVSGGDFEAARLMQAINEFLVLVPSNIGRGRPTARGLFPNISVVQEKNDLLDALEASLNSVLSAPKGTGSDDAAALEAPKVFDLKLHLIEDKAELDRIRAKYNATRNRIHASSSLDVKCAYAVEIGSMKAAFDARAAKVGNVVEYWHGTGAHNVLSILKSGLRVAPPNTARIAGKMFGNGVYFSDQATKSLNYAIGAAPGQAGGWDGRATTFMFLADVAMGRTYRAKVNNEHDWPARGYDSTSAFGGECRSSWGGHLMNNEFIVYGDDYLNLTRLVEFTQGGR
jgi:poly [ADP-ribose] polymerase